MLEGALRPLPCGCGGPGAAVVPVGRAVRGLLVCSGRASHACFWGVPQVVPEPTRAVWSLGGSCFTPGRVVLDRKDKKEIETLYPPAIYDVCTGVAQGCPRWCWGPSAPVE